MIELLVNIRLKDFSLRCCTVLAAFVCFTLAYPGLSFPPQAFAESPVTPSGLNTQVSAPFTADGGNTQHDITGGTRPGGGVNLFHSFVEFGVPTNNIANFLNGVSFDLDGNPLAPGLQTTNILARVTGNIQSEIFGIIQTTGFGDANLFLMNPAGFLFGANATVNVGGMVTFTTAKNLILTDNVRFNAIPDVAVDALLSASPVAAFGFIGSNPHAIDFIGGQLTVAQGKADGTGITLVGGDINLAPDSSGRPSGITAPGRQLQLTSVAGGGDVSAVTGVPAPDMALGNITLGQDTALLTTGDFSFGDGSGSGGSISIRGGQFVATGATITTSPVEGSLGAGGAVTVDVTGSAALTDSQIQTNPVVFSLASSAGAVSITANSSLSMTNTTIDASSFLAGGDAGPVTLQTDGPLSVTDSIIFTNASAPGNGGAVMIKGKDVTLNTSNSTSVVLTDVDNGPFDAASDPEIRQVHPGTVTITAQDTVTLSGSGISNSIISATAFGTLLDAGRVNITGKTVNLSNGTIDTALRDGGIVSPANAGMIEIRSNNVNLTQFGLSSVAENLVESSGTGGSILIRGGDSLHSDNIQLVASLVKTLSGGGGGGGNIKFLTKALTISDHTEVATSSFGPGSGGAVTVSGAETVTIESGSRVATDVVIGLAGAPQGTAGNILVETQNLIVRSGGLIRAGALLDSTGNAGNITVQGNSPAQSILIDGTGSGIFTNTEGTGAGGDIFVNADSVTLQNGGTLSAKTSGTDATATGGSITVKATDQVTMTSGASITASSTGPGNAGNIVINAGQTFVATNSNDAVTTQADAASGGNIAVLATEMIQLTNSRINASVEGSKTTVGGNIMIDPQVVILQNSQIVAKAIQGTGGDISITTNLLLQDATSDISASSQFGVNGTVTIQSPNAPASGKIQPLGNELLEATSLLNQRCAALAGGEFSSFTVAGRDSLPTEPGSWLASPLVAFGAGEALGIRGERVTLGDSLAGGGTLLSLRQIAPTGFLTQAFAQDWSAGCTS